MRMHTSTSDSRQPGGIRIAPLLVKALLGSLLIGFVVLVAANAWLSDDAYITFRTVDNFIHGYGLTWNVDERVQTYTHPLWMFLVSGFYALTHEAYLTSLLISIALSVIAVALVAGLAARTAEMAAFALVVFSVSKAFVDYSTSGLENPLTHLVLAAFLLVYTRGRPSPRRFLFLALLTALGAVNRLDLALLFVPVLLWAFLEAPSWRAVAAGVVGMLPLVGWELFALFYYGTPFPNTALAKLNAGLIPQAAISHEGWLYLVNSLRVDPATLLCIGAGLAVPLAARDWRKLPLAAGIVLYLAYIVRVGGDFMSGRFLTAPMLQAVVIVVSTPWWASRRNPGAVKAALPVIFLIVGLLTPYSPIRASGGRSADQDARVWVRGRSITDERANYYQNTGLLVALEHPGEMPNHDWARDGRAARDAGAAVVVKGSVGFFGYFAGPEVHVVDLLALGDPLLARLPVTDPNWQIGHFGRRPPAGYLDTLHTGENRIADRSLAAYYDKLDRVIRGGLWDAERLREIWKLNTGAFDNLLAAYAYWQGDTFVQRFDVTNPTDAPYVYAYVWNNGAGETYLLDDASSRGEVYPIAWSVSRSGVAFQGSYVRQIAKIGALSDAELLNVGVFFASDSDLHTYEMYERRYWFRFGYAGTAISVVQPALEWYNEAAPGGFWQERPIDDVMQMQP